MNNDEILTKSLEKRGILKVRPINYRLGKYPHKLKHRKLSFFEQLFNIQSGAHCQICGRGEAQNRGNPSRRFPIRGWLQIDDPENKTKSGSSVVCYECWELNPEIFGKFSGI